MLQVQQSIIEVPEIGLSILGISHRSDWFEAVVAELENNIRKLLGLDDNYHVLFLQGGTTQQFSMIPMTLLRGKTAPAEYLHTGYWSGKAITEAKREGSIRELWSGEAGGYRQLPRDEELVFSPDAPYLHYISNETVEGLQFHRMLGRDDVPRVCDMSSDFLSQPCEANRYSLIYAHAQKNIGPAGVTVVLIRDEVVQNAPTDLPGFLDYRNHVQSHSNYNTPPVFAIYVVLLITRWLLDDIGGLAPMAQINRNKAELMYRLLDDSDNFYRGRVSRGPLPDERHFQPGQPGYRKTIPGRSTSRRILRTCRSSLYGRGSASLYNGLTLPAVEQLVGFMEDFQRQHRQ